MSSTHRLNSISHTPAGVVSDEDVAVLRRLKEVLPIVGINGWHRGVRALEAAIAALSAGGVTERDRLEDERWRLMNSFGAGTFADGRTRDSIVEIDTRLAAQHAQPAERVPDVKAIMAHLPDNRAATRCELIRAFTLATSPAPSQSEGGKACADSASRRPRSYTSSPPP